MGKQTRVQLRSCCESKLVKSLSDVDLVLTSPPYNIGSQAAKCLGDRRRGKYDRKSWGAIEHYPDSLPEDKYQMKQRDFLWRYAKVLVEGGVIAYQHKERHIKGVLVQPESWFPDELVLFDRVVWDRGSTHNHCQSYAYQQHEYVYLLKRRGEKHFYNYGRLDSVIRETRAIGVAHNAPMATRVAEAIIAKFSPVGGLVVDPYAGSGTTGVAAVRLGRRFIGSERLKKYAMAARRRIKECAA